MARIFKNPDESAILRVLRVMAVALATVAAMPLASAAEPRHAIAMVGEPALPDGFTALPYANPDAPKGGTIRLAEPGSFDSLKPWVLKGNAVWAVGNLVAETLMFRSIDEPFSLYGLLAESVETDPDRTWVEFTLRPEATFSDGSPVTVEDVMWSYETLGTKGHPRYAGTWAKVAKMEQTGPRSLRLTFNTPDRELAMLMGLRPVLKKAQWEGKDFAESSLEPPIGSGPYVISKVDPGRSATFTRDPDWWGRDLPVNRGLHNLDTIRYDYFADTNAMFQAFKAGEIDAWRELDAAKWTREYNFPLLTQGRVVKDEIAHRRPSGIMGLVMNIRHPAFADWRVRQAMIEAFNYRFINETLTGGTDPRITSYFANSDLAMRPGPAGPAVAGLLAPFADDLPQGAMDGYALPPGAAQALDRKGLRAALALLKDAGWTIHDDGVLRRDDGTPFAFDIVLNQSGSAMRSGSEVQRIVDVYIQALKHIGIRPNVTLLDSAQFIERTNRFDFAMAWYERGLSLSPGNEQALYWGSASALQNGSKNWMGVASPAVDAMIDRMVNATTAGDYTAAVQALDRLLTAGRYVIPVSYSPFSRVAHSAALHYPDRLPIYGDWPGFMPDTWWWDAGAMPAN